MPLRPRKLARRLSWTFVFTIVVIETSLFFLFSYLWRTSLDETFQRANWGIANDIVSAIRPGIEPVFDEAAVRERILPFLLYNPWIDVHLVDAQGAVVSSYVTDPTIPRASNINLTSVKALLGRENIALPVRGDDPLNPGMPSVFSVSPLSIHGEEHYLYVVLVNAWVRRTTEHFRNSSLILSSAVFAILVTACATGIALLFLRRTSQRFSGIMESVYAVEKGDFSKRAPDEGEDELSSMGSAINSMSGSISQNIESLKKKDLQRRELIANIWHDIRGPVTSIGAMAGSLQRYPKLAAGEQENLSSGILANVEMLDVFLAELRELALLESGERAPNLEKCSLSLIADDLQLAVQAAARERNIDLCLAIPGDLPAVLADSVMITRVLANLTHNALRYTPWGGRITIEAVREDDRVRVLVRDTGVGIHPNDLPFIFERNFQSPNQLDFQQGSAGLGLAIVKRMVECNGGEIRVESSEDVGSTFSFSLLIHTPMENELRS